jgi:hypothetical protein
MDQVLGGSCSHIRQDRRGSGLRAVSDAPQLTYQVLEPALNPSWKGLLSRG